MKMTKLDIPPIMYSGVRDDVGLYWDIDPSSSADPLRDRKQNGKLAVCPFARARVKLGGIVLKV